MLIRAPFLTIFDSGKAGTPKRHEARFSREIAENKDTTMTTNPLVDHQVEQYAARLVYKPEDIWRFELKAREIRAREFARFVRAGWGWVKTYIVEPIASAIRAEHAYRELMALDDRTLADIGISRGEISAIVARSIAPRAEAKRTVSVKAVAAVRKPAPSQAQAAEKRVA
jgi:uncharacterized protein YjiS (DUF1127 family)